MLVAVCPDVRKEEKSAVPFVCASLQAPVSVAPVVLKRSDAPRVPTCTSVSIQLKATEPPVGVLPL